MTVVGAKSFCRKCGSQLSERSMFCPKCGTPVPATALSPSIPLGTSAPTPQPPRGKEVSITEANDFARDRLRRGDTPANVTSQLVLSGFPRDHAMTIINGAQVELRRARKKAWRRRGGQLLGVGITLIIPTYAYQSIGGGGAMPSAILTGFGVLELAGIALLISGIAAMVYSFT